MNGYQADKSSFPDRMHTRIKTALIVKEDLSRRQLLV